MSGMADIEPVGRRHEREAIRFVVGGGRRDALTEARAEVLRDAVGLRGPGAVRLWWARHRRKCAAAAMIIESPGKTGMLLHSPAAATGVDGEALRDLLSAISADALAGGLSMVQSLLEAAAEADVATIRAAGFQPLAELIYLRRALTRPAAPPAQEQLAFLAFRSAGEFREGELAEVISSTYEGSLDCPALSAVREVDDVIKGHKHTGVFSPECWWIADRGGDPAGCILVNDSTAGASVEVVYMGVAPAHRGRGLGRAMIRHAAEVERQRGRKSMTLAVDSRNAYAMAVYKAEGFQETDRRLAHAMLRIAPAEGSR